MSIEVEDYDYKDDLKKNLIGLVPGAGEYKAYKENVVSPRGNYPHRKNLYIGSSIGRTAAASTAAAGLASQSPEGAVAALAVFPVYFILTAWTESELVPY